MIFRFLLWVLALRINYLSNRNDGFKQAIEGKECVLQFKTADLQVKRYYAFNHGKTTSRGAVHDNASMAIVFENAKVAMGLIKSMANNPNDPSVFMKAMQAGQLKIEGDMGLMMWFMQIAKYFGPQKKK